MRLTTRSNRPGNSFCILRVSVPPKEKQHVKKSSLISCEKAVASGLREAPPSQSVSPPCPHPAATDPVSKSVCPEEVALPHFPEVQGSCWPCSLLAPCKSWPPTLGGPMTWAAPSCPPLQPEPPAGRSPAPSAGELLPPRPRRCTRPRAHSPPA